MKLDKINLTYKPEEYEKTKEPQPVEPEVEPETYLDPHDFTAISLKSDQLILNGQDLGSVKMDIRKISGGLSLESTVIKPDQLSLILNGQWIKTPDKPKSQFEFDLDTTEVGDC